VRPVARGFLYICRSNSVRRVGDAARLQQQAIFQQRGVEMSSKRSRENDGAAARRKTARTGGRRSRSATEQRYQELLDGALDLFVEKGFDGATVDAISAHVGIAKRTVYARYKDKAALFKAALEQAIERWVIPIDVLRAVETDDCEETLFTIARVLAHSAMSPAGFRLVRITNAESYRLPEIGVFAMERATDRMLDYLADLFQRHQREGHLTILGDPRAAAMAFFLLVGSSVTLPATWGKTLNRADVEERVRYSVRLLLEGMRPRQAAAGAG
jgi:TetR/AcrR family transcriptional repressor of mexJK operon